MACADQLDPVTTNESKASRSTAGMTGQEPVRWARDLKAESPGVQIGKRGFVTPRWGEWRQEQLRRPRTDESLEPGVKDAGIRR
jgi:hypothetical protein